LAFARLAREHPASWRLLGSGILIAAAVMFLRTGALAVALNSQLLVPLLPFLGAGTAILGIGAAVIWLNDGKMEAPRLLISNPLELGTAIKLAALLAAIMLVAELVRRLFGDVGVLIVAGLSGIADVDAVTVTMSRAAGTQIDARTAVLAIEIAIAVNSVSKAVLAGVVAGRKIGLVTGGISFTAVAGGVLATLIG
jgi:uncharacterized membrane protein (DUF4010 family)